MRCEELERIVISGGEVTDEMRKHAASCAACRALLENADVLSGAADLDADVQVPDSFAASWRAAVRSDAAKRREKAEKGNLLERAKMFLTGGNRRMVRGLAYALCAVVLVGAGAQLGDRESAGVAYSMANAAKSRAMGAPMLGAGNGGVMMASAYDGAVAYDEAAVEEAAFEAGAQQERKIIRTAQLDLEVEDMDGAMLSITAQAESAGGVISYSEVSGQKGEGRWGNMEVQVPSAWLDSFLAGAGSLGTVTRQSSQQTDMTSQYRDNASRLESARAQKQRLDELYAQAQDMTDIVTITDALFEVQQEIDDLTGANAWIDDRANMSRVYLSLTELADEEDIPDPTFFEQLGEHFTDGVNAIVAFFSNLVLFGAWALPWIALAAVMAGVVFFLRRRFK